MFSLHAAHIQHISELVTRPSAAVASASTTVGPPPLGSIVFYKFSSRSSYLGLESLHVKFLGTGVYLLLPDDGEGAEWIRFLHGGSVEDEGDNYDVSILTSMTWRLLFPNGGIKAEMVLPSWNNFLRSLLCFIVVRSGYDEGLGRIVSRSVFLILRWHKEEGRH